MASGKPFSPSTQAMKKSLAPRFCRSVRICNQNFAPSLSAAHRPRTSLLPPAAPPAAAVYKEEKVAEGFGGDRAGTVLLLADGVRPSLIAWGNGRATLFRNGGTAVPDS